MSEIKMKKDSWNREQGRQIIFLPKIDEKDNIKTILELICHLHKQKFI